MIHLILICRAELAEIEAKELKWKSEKAAAGREWEAVVDEWTGDTYYCNLRTGQVCIKVEVELFFYVVLKVFFGIFYFVHVLSINRSIDRSIV